MILYGEDEDLIIDYIVNPLIICHHKIKIINLEKLYKYLAITLNINLNIYNSKNVLIGNYNNNSNKSGKLSECKSSILPAMKFKLNLNNFNLIFYNDFIEINHIIIDFDYYNLKKMHETNILKKESHFKVLFKQLKLLGVEKIYFSILEESENIDSSNFCFKIQELSIVEKINYFKVIIN